MKALRALWKTILVASPLVLLLASACGNDPPESIAEPRAPEEARPGTPASQGNSIGLQNEVGWARDRLHMMLEILEEGTVHVSDGAVLAAFVEVHRHPFVGAEAQDRAYANEPVPIGEGEVTSKPYLLAVMTQALELRGNERVLEIGTGTGYHAAILSRLAREVTTFEINPVLAARARELLSVWAVAPVRVIEGDGGAGLPEEAPFDAIIVSQALLHYPTELFAQLAHEGRLVVPLGLPGDQYLTLIRKRREGPEIRRLLRVRFGMLRHQ